MNDVSKQLEKTASLIQKRMDECDGDFTKYVEKYNRHTLKVSLTDEQVKKELWSGSEITFFNEDNAISHLTFVNDLLELLTEEKNRDWGTRKANTQLVDRITNFVRDRVSPPETGQTRKNLGENLIPTSNLTEDLKKKLYQEEETND